MVSHWRRFVPRRQVEPRHVMTLEDGSRLSTIRNLQDADVFIDGVKAMPAHTQPDVEWQRLHTLLLAQTPRAVRAQIQMDRHKHGYHHREKRLFELIDFNDAFVALVLATPAHDLPGLAERLRDDMTRFCRRLKTPMFSREQYDAIVRGLSREIAVFKAAEQQGFQVHMTNRVEDAFGIDMVITDPATGKQLNIDCKTASAFRYRMEDLIKEGRISEAELLEADQRDFLTVQQHRARDHQTVAVTLLCIRSDTLGEIADFTFNEPARLTALLANVFATVV